MSQQIVKNKVCPECGSGDLVRDLEMGERVCSGCGLVIRETILDRGAEWRAFTPEERRSKARAGAPTKYSHYDKGLSTSIRIERDALGRPLTPETRRQMWRLRKWQIRHQMHQKERNLRKAMNEIQRLSEKLKTPSTVREMAAVIYRKALNEDLVRGRSIAAISAAALYAACRYTKNPRTLKEIAGASLRDRREISRAYRMIVENLEMRMPVDDPMDYVSKIAEKAGVSGDVEALAIKIIQDAKKKHATTGKDPSGLAAAALYVASRLKREKTTQQHLAKAGDVSTVTMRNRSVELRRRLDLRFN